MLVRASSARRSVENSNAQAGQARAETRRSRSPRICTSRAKSSTSAPGQSYGALKVESAIWGTPVTTPGKADTSQSACSQLQSMSQEALAAPKTKFVRFESEPEVDMDRPLGTLASVHEVIAQYPLLKALPNSLDIFL